MAGRCTLSLSPKVIAETTILLRRITRRSRPVATDPVHGYPRQSGRTACASTVSMAGSHAATIGSRARHIQIAPGDNKVATRHDLEMSRPGAAQTSNDVPDSSSEKFR